MDAASQARSIGNETSRAKTNFMGPLGVELKQDRSNETIQHAQICMRCIRDTLQSVYRLSIKSLIGSPNNCPSRVANRAPSAPSMTR